MAEVSVDALQDAIRNLHDCESQFVESVPVTETHDGQIVWGGVVQVFDLIDHPEAERAYAWSHEVDDSDARRFVVVLHQRPVDSAQAAVKAAIAAEYREGVSDG